MNQRQYLRTSTNLYTVKPAFKLQKPIIQTQYVLGCIYRMDTGNSNWVSGMLLQVDGSDATIIDARGVKHIGITSTLLSLQATR